MSLTSTRKKMKEGAGALLVTVFVALFIISIFLVFNNGGGGGSAAVSDAETFAQINGEKVSNAQFDQVLGQFRRYASMGRSVPVSQQAEFPQYAYEQLLQEYAQAAAAKASGISVSPGEAEREISQQIDQQIEQVAPNATREEKAEYRAALRQAANVDTEQRQLASRRLSERLSQEARPIEMRVAHVLVKTDERTDAAARQLAQEIARRARAGEEFTKLVKQYSEDEGSKAKDGVVGWASAMPTPPDPDPKNQSTREPAASFVPEFTAASLRLKKGEVSDPVKTQFGYHVIKAVEERPYEPPAGDAKDPKKREEAVNSYKQAVGTSIERGLYDAYKAQLTVTPVSDWLKGYLAEQEIKPEAPPAADSAAKVEKAEALKKAEALGKITGPYAAALKDNEPAAGPGLAWKLARLQLWTGQWYQRSGQEAQATAHFAQAQETADKWAKRSRDAELYALLGQTLEAQGNKTEALAAYQKAMDEARSNAMVVADLRDRFKGLGRADLAQKAAEKQSQILARQAEEAAEQRKQQEAAMKKFEEEQKAAEAAQKATDKTAGVPTPSTGQGATPPTGQGEVVDEVTVTTGDIDPKTGKPKILSVERKSDQEKAAGSAPATNKP